MTPTLNCICLTIKMKHPLSLLAFTFLPLSTFFPTVFIYTMQKCQLRENEIATWAAKCSLFFCLPFTLTTSRTLQSVCFELLSSAGGLLSTGKHRSLFYCQPSAAGLISEQANQIWSRNVHFLHRLWDHTKWGRLETWPVSHGEHASYPTDDPKSNTYWCRERRGSIVSWTLTSMHTTNVLSWNLNIN